MRCSIEGCTKDAKFRGWCYPHYQRWQRWGTPTGGRKTNEGEPRKFLEEALKYTGNDCLMWPFGKVSTGYGNIQWNGKKELVSRLVCRAVHGDPEDVNSEAAHSCGNGHLSCITPQHLRWATRKENEADKINHGTRPHGEHHVGSKLTAENVAAIRNLAGTVSQYRLAERFGVTQGRISNIINNKGWRFL